MGLGQLPSACSARGRAGTFWHSEHPCCPERCLQGAPRIPFPGWGSACPCALWGVFKVAPFNSALRILGLMAGSVIFKLPSATSRCKDEKPGRVGAAGHPSSYLTPCRWCSPGPIAAPAAAILPLGAGSRSGHFQSGWQDPQPVAERSLLIYNRCKCFL